MVLVIMKKKSEAQKFCTLSMRLHALMECIRFTSPLPRRLNSLCGSRGQNKDQLAAAPGRQAGMQRAGAPSEGQSPSALSEPQEARSEAGRGQRLVWSVLEVKSKGYGSNLSPFHDSPLPRHWEE